VIFPSSGRRAPWDSSSLSIRIGKQIPGIYLPLIPLDLDLGGVNSTMVHSFDSTHLRTKGNPESFVCFRCLKRAKICSYSREIDWSPFNQQNWPLVSHPMKSVLEKSVFGAIWLLVLPVPVPLGFVCFRQAFWWFCNLESFFRINLFTFVPPLSMRFGRKVYWSSRLHPFSNFRVFKPFCLFCAILPLSYPLFSGIRFIRASWDVVDLWRFRVWNCPSSVTFAV